MDCWRVMRAAAAAVAVLSAAAGALAQPGSDKPAPPGPAGEEPKQPEGEKAKGPSLKAGDKAPALTIEKWVKGEPVTGLEKGRIYVVEFWATSNPSSLESIPHLTELAKKHKKDGVTVIGVSEETGEVVAPFVEKMGDKMDYVVAVDKHRDDRAVTSAEWRRAAGKGTVPTAFIVDKDQKIAWIGHPTDGMDKVLVQVIAGTFDAKKHAEESARREAEAAAKTAQKRRLVRAMQEAVENEDWPKAEMLLDELAGLDAATARQAGVTKFQLMLFMKKDYPGAYAQATKLSEGILKDDAEALNEMAWTILDSEGVEKRDLDLAMKIAQRAVEVSKGEDGMILDTLARAYYEKKDLDKAIEWQKKAVEKGGKDENMLDDMKQTLKKYEAEKATGGGSGEKK